MLSSKELNTISDVDFLLTKAQALSKIRQLFEQTKSKLEIAITERHQNLPAELDLTHGKISRGENYRGLPYLVLDYPAHFSRQNIMAYRTMFWWGHFFSFTFHLQGSYWDRYRKNILNQLNLFIADDVFICVNNTPWEYHYNPDNYLKIDQIEVKQIEELDFLKISTKIDLDQWSLVPSESSNFLSNCIARCGINSD